MSGLLSSRKRLAVVVGALMLAAAVGLAVFKPWLLFVDASVDDEIPVFSVGTTPPAAEGGEPEAQSPNQDASEPTTPTTSASQEETQGPSTTAQGPVQVASGSFISHEHDTSGTARILSLPDGSHQLVLENLSTSNGPDVRVWLSAGPVIEGRDGWFTAGRYEHLEVAPIKGNLGNHVYDLPAGTDPSAWTSVVLWCEDFSVSFGAAELASA